MAEGGRDPNGAAASLRTGGDHRRWTSANSGPQLRFLVLGLALFAACEKRRPDPTVANTTGLALIGHEQYDSAITVLNQAIAAKPDFAEAYRNRGRAYRGKGDYDRALSDFDRAIALKPDNPAY